MKKPRRDIALARILQRYEDKVDQLKQLEGDTDVLHLRYSVECIENIKSLHLEY